jgi:tetratricopeptide (TPR) repeat protein
MLLPDGRPLVVADGILPEPTGVGGRIVLWLRGGRVGNYQHWERVGSLPHAVVTAERGIRATAAASVPARQWVGGPIGKVFRTLGRSRPDRRWVLPDGAWAEQCGARRSDVMFAWSEDDSSPLDEGRIRLRWGTDLEIRPIGPGVCLVSGVGPSPPQPATGPSPPQPATGPSPASQDTPRRLAERALAAAQGAGDDRREVTALADLGLACLKEQDYSAAEEALGEAVAGARRIGDPSLEAGAMMDLGLVAVFRGRPDQAIGLLGPALAAIRAMGDRHDEKLVLERLGQAHAALRDHTGAVGFFEQALAIAEGLGDGPHRADVLWQLGIQYAELGHHDRASAHAQAAVEGMRRLGRPQAEWYARHLADFRSGGPPPRAAAPDGVGREPGLDLISSIDTDTSPAPRRGPGPLRMAITAADAMAKFVGSGFRAASPETYRERVETCASCEHHTGLRCRICGCFTAAKARFGHERCPLGKWRA